MPDMELKQTFSQNRGGALKALAVVGFVAVLIFGAWGLIQVGRMLPNVGSALSAAAVSLSSLFVPAERLEITIPTANVNSGEPFTLTWEHVNKRAEGTYTVTFSCRDGLSMETVASNGLYQKVFCNTPFNLTNATESMKLIPISNNVRFLDVPITLQFTRLSDGKVTASTETAITVINEKVSESGTPITATTTKPVAKPPVTTRPGTPSQNTYNITVAGRASDPNGRPDLAVTILDSGSINPANNVFTSGGTVRKSDRAAVRFVVENRGTKTVDNWSFNAVLPTFPMHIFSSDMQPMLGPGDRIEYTLGFDMVDGGTTGGTFTVNVDPANSIWNEVSENNNIAKVIFTIIN